MQEGQRQERGQTAWEAENEHRDTAKLTGPITAIQRDYGLGVLMYMQYIRFLICLNVILTGITAVGFLTSSGGNSSVEYTGLSTWFLSSADPGRVGWWYVFTTCAAVLGLALGPIWRKVGPKISQHYEEAGEDAGFAPSDDVIEANARVSSRNRRHRKQLSVILFVVIIVAQGFFTWELHNLMREQNSEIVALVLAVSITMLNLVWKMVSKYMTVFEKHKRKSTANAWETGKVFVLKLANVLALFITKALQPSTSEGDGCPAGSDFNTGDSECTCPIASMAYQFFFLVVSDVTIGNLIEIGYPLAMLCWNSRRAARLKSRTGDESAKQPFELSEEYTEVLYRQFVILLGMSVFPLMPLVGFVSFVVEYFLDKVKLIYLCQKPLVKPLPVDDRLLMACHLLVGIAALVSYPNGTAFIFAEFGLSDCFVFS